MRLFHLFKRSRRDRQLASELQAHLAAETEDNIARGMPSEQARDAAQRKLGNLTGIREDVFHAGGFQLLDNAWQDLRYALRTMRASAAFTLTAILTLALGIAGNTAMFGVIHAVLLRPLPYMNPQRLVYFSVDNPQRQQTDNSFSLEQFQQIKSSAHSFTAVGAYGRPENVALSANGDPEMLQGARVSANFLTVLGVRPLLGRSFLPQEDVRNGPPVALLSSELWRRRFASDPSIPGKSVTSIPLLTQSSVFCRAASNFRLPASTCGSPALRNGPCCRPVIGACRC